MLKKTIGFIIFLGVVIYSIGTENTLYFLDKPSIIIVSLGPLAMLFAHVKKGMSKNHILKKLKEYIIFSAWLGTIVGIILMLSHYKINFEMLNESLFTLQSILIMCLMTLFWGYLFAYIVDIFIDEE